MFESIKKQSKKPGQTIIVFDKKKNFKSSKNNFHTLGKPIRFCKELMD